MTRDEYKENLIKIWDSLRTDEYKGQADCKGVKCTHCPFSNKICNVGGSLLRAYEAIEIVERWIDKHSIVTNAMKFKEVFGTGDAEGMCVCRDRCEYCKYYIPDDGECGVQAKFWNAEYKPIKKCEE